MRNDNDFPKPVVKPVSMGGCPHQARRHSQRQYPVELTHQTFLPHAWIIWVRFWSGTRQCHQRRRASLFDQGAESHVQRRLEQCRYPGQERLGLRQTVKHLTGGGVVPDREQHKKVWSLDLFTGGEADRPVPAAESRKLLNELLATFLLRRQELYIDHGELLCVSSSRPMSRKGEN